MYTSYFSNLRNVNYPVSICSKAPAWYHGPQYKVLAPKYNFFMEWKYGSHKGDNEYYIKMFKSLVLDQLSIDKVIDDISKFYPGVSVNDITLICYEVPTAFCHRHLVADWLTDNGYKTEELINK